MCRFQYGMQAGAAACTPPTEQEREKIRRSVGPGNPARSYVRLAIRRSRRSASQNKAASVVLNT